MNKSGFYRSDRSSPMGFFICAALFIAGCIAGAIASGYVPSDTQVGDIFSAAADTGFTGFGVRFASALVSSGKFHLFALFFAFSVLGVIGIPAVSALRGFLICFTASSAVRFYGTAGVPFTLLMFAPDALIAIPSLFLLSAKSLSASGTLLRSAAMSGGAHSPPFGNGFVRQCAICTVMLCAAALIEASIAPLMLGLLPA